MYSETVAAIGSAGSSVTYYDEETQSDIAYFTGMGADGYTTPGTWITYNGARSMQAIASYVVAQGLGGAFLFDTSMDTLESGTWTYNLTHTVANALGVA